MFMQLLSITTSAHGEHNLHVPPPDLYEQGELGHVKSIVCVYQSKCAKTVLAVEIACTQIGAMAEHFGP